MTVQEVVQAHFIEALKAERSRCVAELEAINERNEGLPLRKGDKVRWQRLVGRLGHLADLIDDLVEDVYA